MLILPPRVRVFLAAGVTIEEDPLSGHLFVFCNRRRDRLKILFWESSGYWLSAKRLEKGTFAWPDASVARREYTASELALLLGGIDLKKCRRRRWYERRKKVQEACR